METTAQVEKLFTVAELAKLAGLSERTIRDYIERGRIGARYITDRRLRIGEAEARRFLQGTPAAAAAS